VLVARFPLQATALDTLLDDYLNNLGLLGEWRPTLPAFASMATP
jgi:hypothetical protein